MRRLMALAASTVLVATAPAAAPVSAAPAARAPSAGSDLASYVAPATPELYQRLGEVGVDRHEVAAYRDDDGPPR